jgi:hypothetical protein
MAIRKCCVGVFLLMLCSGAALSAETDKLQFPKTGNGDAEYLWQHGRDSFRPAAEVETGYMGYLPGVALLIGGVMLFERFREKRLENEWRGEQPADGPLDPLVPMDAMAALGDESEPPTFQAITTEELWRFTRPSLGLETPDPNLHVEIPTQA